MRRAVLLRKDGPMFYTLTANPAVDMTVQCPTLVPNENIRSVSAAYTANGKGLDVSFALKKFGVDSVALGFFAGFTLMHFFSTDPHKGRQTQILNCQFEDIFRLISLLDFCLLKIFALHLVH